MDKTGTLSTECLVHFRAKCPVHFRAECPVHFPRNRQLVYDDLKVELTIKSNPNTNPYSLISKKDGSLISVLDIHLPKRNSTSISQKTSDFDSFGQMIAFPSGMYYGQNN